MYEAFIKNYGSSEDKLAKSHYAFSENINTDVKNLFNECGEHSFKSGLYRVHSPESSLQWSTLIGNYFVKYKGRIIPFGYDWMGRQFAIDATRKDYILMFDPATAEDMELNQSLESFHNIDLLDERESFLSEQLFYDVIKSLGLSEVTYKNCLGYKIPLFLNGPDTIGNYEVSDMEVYWEVQCQIYLQIKDLPPGTKINSVKFE